MKPWYYLGRHAGHDRAWYSERFDRIEATATAFGGSIRSLASSGQWTPSGLAVQANDLMAAANDQAMGALTLISNAIDADRKVIADALGAPKPVPSVEVGLAIQYAQNVVLAKYTGPNAADRQGMWGDLRRALDAGDAVQAQVLADLLPSLVTTSGPGDTVTAGRIEDLQQQAARLRATPELRAALALQDTLNGSYDQAPGVAAKASFVKMSLGARLSLILQRDGADPLTGIFALDYPLPPGFENGASMAMSPAYLAQAFRVWFTV